MRNITILCIVMTVIFYATVHASPLPTIANHPALRTVDFVIDGMMEEKDLKNVFDFLKETLKNLKVNQTVRVIGPRTSHRVERIASFSVQENVSWPQKRHLWKASLRNVEQFFAEMIREKATRSNVKDVLEYIVRNRAKDGDYEVVFFSNFEGSRSADDLKDDLNGIFFHLIFLGKNFAITRDNVEYWADAIQNQRGGKIVTKEAGISELRGRLGKRDLPALKIASYKRDTSRPNGAEKIVIELVWQKRGVDLDLIVRKSGNELSYRNPESDFGEWARSSDAASGNRFFEKVFLNEQVLIHADDYTVEVAHVNGPPPVAVAMNVYKVNDKKRVLTRQIDLSSGVFTQTRVYQGDPQKRLWKLSELLVDTGSDPVKTKAKSNEGVVPPLKPIQPAVKILLKSVPKYGDMEGFVEGSVSGISPSAYHDYKLNVYIFVASWGWALKPYLDTPDTEISMDGGTFRCQIFTGGVDETFTKLAVYLFAKNHKTPRIARASNLPRFDAAVASIIVDRSS